MADDYNDDHTQISIDKIVNYTDVSDGYALSDLSEYLMHYPNLAHCHIFSVTILVLSTCKYTHITRSYIEFLPGSYPTLYNDIHMEIYILRFILKEQWGC